MRSRRTLLFVAFLSGASPVLAQTLDQQQKALAIIRETAADICGSVPLSQVNQQVDLSGNAKVKLSGAVGKIINAGLSGATKYKSGSSEGVLQKDLADAIKNGTDCRRSVLNILVPRMVVPAGNGKSTPADRLPLGRSEPRLFKMPVGYFKKQGSLWIEYPAYAQNLHNTFQETGSDEKYIYLIDPSRSKPNEDNNAMIVRLPIRGGSAQWSFQNPVNWATFTTVTPSS